MFFTLYPILSLVNRTYIHYGCNEKPFGSGMNRVKKPCVILWSSQKKRRKNEMDSLSMQALIDTCDTPADMIGIAQAYLNGAVLRDKVAAEAWLMKAIEAEDPAESPRAMAVLARSILHRPMLTREDAEDIRRQARTAQGEQRQQLLDLLALNEETEKCPV